jgi:hypothetical protein
MQTQLRSTGETLMKKADYDRFVAAYAEGRLVKPDDCGHVIAALSILAPKGLSGQFVSWDAEECKQFRKETL